MSSQSFESEIAWLREASRYFSARPTNGEDSAHWANVYNAKNANDIADRLAALSEGKIATEGEWRPIETAPKDGTEILIYRNGWQEAPRAKWGDHEGEADDGEIIIFGGWFLASEWQTYGCEDGFLGWNEDADVMPTHWMPLPASPNGEDR